MKKLDLRETGRRAAVLLTAVLTVFAAAACGGSSNTEYSQADMATQTAEDYESAGAIYENTYTESAAPSEEMIEEAGVDTQRIQDPAAGRKLITTVGLDVETYSFQQLLASIEQKTAALGGYIEMMDTYNGSVQYDDSRQASLKIRIPENRLDEFVESVEGQANITNRSESVEDVTLTYVDLKSHKDALQIEQSRLLELLERAESLEDILTIESRLSEVRYQLESMESQLRTLQDQVDFSTVNLQITEVKQYSAPATLTAWERISTGFSESCRSVGTGLKDFMIGFIVSLPYLLVATLLAGLLIGLVVFLVRHENKKQAEKKKKKQPAAGQAWLNVAESAAENENIGAAGKPEASQRQGSGESQAANEAAAGDKDKK